MASFVNMSRCGILISISHEQCKSNAHKPGTIVQTDVSLDKHLQRNVSVIINTAFINADVK